MEFGNVHGNLEGINFALPLDPIETTTTLQAAKNTNQIEVHVGGTKWADKTWLGRIYPRKLASSEFLRVYAENFNTIEFGATFYNVYKAEELNRWHEQVSGSTDFKFLPKFPQAITHIRRLRNAALHTTLFYEGLVGLGNHLGPLLLQLPEHFAPNSFPFLKSYLESLPATFKVTIETRHKEWFEEENRKRLYELLKGLNIAWAVTDAPGRRDCVHMMLPTADAIIRFVGATPELTESEKMDGSILLMPNETDYARLDEWVERLKNWKEQGLQSIWFFIHQHNERFTPMLCDYFIQQLNLKLGLQVKRPTLL